VSRLPSITPDQLVVALQRAGLQIVREGANHTVLWKEGLVKAGGDSFTGAVTLAPGTYDVWCPVSNSSSARTVAGMTPRIPPPSIDSTRLSTRSVMCPIPTAAIEPVTRA